MITEAVNFGLTTDQYGKSPDIQAVMTMYLNTLAGKGFTYYAAWSFDFAPESKLDTSGLELL